MGLLGRVGNALVPRSFEAKMALGLGGVAGLGAIGQFREDAELAPIIESIQKRQPETSYEEAREIAKALRQTMPAAK